MILYRVIGIFICFAKNFNVLIKVQQASWKSSRSAGDDYWVLVFHQIVFYNPTSLVICFLPPFPDIYNPR